ncbi:hypothetical protein BN7_2355 [Wickerhamomyces ciferrii]|uniref:Uncharacterized protein n=1 Tax=Wickerhamomyces ciferrii (strain ATCC 14091 / BCRC 22168 / CBS 111 / JCM 3599 / NBRC 0793 / NRRL Y-1031 F-60-10) TaxID=1206466 RepID=K0KIK7_WICCF|nr:uncharacterized protein BN7_2355 [Wickerhamomyces ciferrii]CCH42811.1 hypothetical protein BN7_2355 [Wickerhamomyces ciferrii]
MSQFQDTENVDPRHLNNNESNSFPNHHVKPTLKNYTNSIIKNSKNHHHQQQQQQKHSIPKFNYQTPKISQTRVPVINSMNSNDIRLSVKNALKHESNRFEVGVLNQNSLKSSNNNLNNIPLPKSPLDSIKINTSNTNFVKKSSSPTSPSTSSNIDNLSLLEIYNKDHEEIEQDNDDDDDDANETIKPKSSKSIFMTNNNDDNKNLQKIEEENYLDFHFDDEYYEDACDPRISYLQPHKPFVDVIPLMLGEPLSSNDTPLNLSSVPKLTKASPFFGMEEDKVEISKDELKLYEALKYDKSFPICPINWKGEIIGPPIDDAIYNNNHKVEFEIEDENGNGNRNEFDEDLEPKGPYFGKISSYWIGGFFQKLLKLGPFSNESKLYDKYPWAKIFYDVENKDNHTNITESKTMKIKKGTKKEFKEIEFNEDMFPAKYSNTPLDEFVDNYTNLRRQKHTFVPAS